ncbi:hypothetical protein BCR34DRAFT_41291 [Clohesyomyces aquaticus]|uniref:Uncharacterized protein n=1 Tax=Clohesyomyces aquaticus TaxID=1231657 RepID=A0A1Y1Z7D3_9PLEO|nr:hypothetical protein BCR34DRAFT_41291 [Clohesyomyces aquaticus]
MNGNGRDSSLSPKRLSPSPSKSPSLIKSPSSSKHIRIPDHLQRPHLNASHRSLSDALRAVRSREEQETLLGDDEAADPDGCLREDGLRGGPREIFCRDPHQHLPVYYSIHR